MLRRTLNWNEWPNRSVPHFSSIPGNYANPDRFELKRPRLPLILQPACLDIWRATGFRRPTHRRPRRESPKQYGTEADTGQDATSAQSTILRNLVLAAEARVRFCAHHGNRWP